jgi:hypothetical protein
MPKTYESVGSNSKLPDASTNSSDRRKELDITIGREFEFILTEYRPTKGKLQKDERDKFLRSAQAAVREVLKQPCKMPCPLCKEYAYQLPPSTSDVADPEKWQVATDETINPIEGFYELAESMDKYIFHPIEVRSRKLHLNVVDKNFLHHHITTYMEEIKSVLRRIVENFTSAKNFQEKPGRYFAFVGPSCGLHIQVGNNKDIFPFTTIQKILCLSTACEKQLDCLHGCNRITGFDFSAPPNGLTRILLPGAKVITEAVHSLPLSMVFMAEANEHRWIDKEKHGRDILPESTQSIELFQSKVRQWNTRFTEDEIWVAQRLCNIDSWLAFLRCASNMKELKAPFSRIGRRYTVNIQNMPHR